MRLTAPKERPERDSAQRKHEKSLAGHNIPLVERAYRASVTAASSPQRTQVTCHASMRACTQLARVARLSRRVWVGTVLTQLLSH
jgi:hypothetical protein